MNDEITWYYNDNVDDDGDNGDHDDVGDDVDSDNNMNK